MGSPRAVALLRGINVGGHRKVPMAELRAALDEAGLGPTATYVQSGNVVIGPSGSEPAALAVEVAGIVEERFGFAVPVVVRSAPELVAIVEGNPFVSEAAGDPTKVHVVFLADLPAGDAEVSSPGGSERTVRCGRTLYVHYPDGAGRSKLTLDVVERSLGTTATARNWRTVLALAEMVVDPSA